ncbi:MAG TPA: cyclopropane-fatty-acyl-phospholipid synthase family protein [Vicinamibacterales bacterium]|nr:cyclopropane-fatty-acyl-phospholipid synthase family protein [Vicinamibacterales bacterium]
MKRELPRALSVPALSNVSTPQQSTNLDRWALERIQRTVRTAPIRFLLWDGFELPSSLAGPAVGSILFRTREALLGWMWNPELYFGETYMSGAVEVRGELSRVLDEIYLAWSSSSSRVWSWWQKANDALTARENVHHHYDLGNEFYRLWLDAELVYTCAYFPTPDATLEEAQIAKMDLVCRKLRLAPGEKVLEAGCGWGSFALFMAKHYGVTVRAFNISAEQMEYARRRAHDEGLADRVEFVEDDYRNVTGRYDAFVSIGMLEHVGLPDYPTLGRVMNRSLLPNGRGLLHFIGRNRPALLNAWIRKRIFPGAYPPTLREVFERVLEPHTLSVLDVENLRLHYARTLEHWLRRFDDASEEVDRMFDQSFTRAWRLYLAGSRAAFVTGWMQLFQVVFARGGSNAIPWTRVSG